MILLLGGGVKLTLMDWEERGESAFLKGHKVYTYKPNNNFYIFLKQMIKVYVSSCKNIMFLMFFLEL